MGAEDKLRGVAAKLDETAEKLGGTSNVDSGVEVGYTEDSPEDRAQEAAGEQGVTLRRNADGSHTAVDESQQDSDINS
ncbi:hypothetical protein AAFP32_01640 [Brevibacterium sp. CBA3109]|uniref:Uncharacterized protein n=1 Tax=Brevibacterium koreense TaxID=3140787 RepID=A0AAU7UM35_9MICO